MSFIVSILQLPPVTLALKKLTEKLFGKGKGINQKVQVAGGIPVLIAAAIAIISALYPELGAILAEHKATMLGLIALIGALLAYFTPEQEVA